MHAVDALVGYLAKGNTDGCVRTRRINYQQHDTSVYRSHCKCYFNARAYITL